MIISHVYRRALLLSIAVILGVSMLILLAASLPFAHAQASRGMQYSTSRLENSHKAPSRNITSHPADASTVDNCTAVPSWDLVQKHLVANGQLGLVRVYVNWETNVMS